MQPKFSSFSTKGELSLLEEFKINCLIEDKFPFNDRIKTFYPYIDEAFKREVRET